MIGILILEVVDEVDVSCCWEGGGLGECVYK